MAHWAQSDVSACIHLVVDLVIVASAISCLYLTLRIEWGRVKDIDVFVYLSGNVEWVLRLFGVYEVYGMRWRLRRSINT